MKLFHKIWKLNHMWKKYFFINNPIKTQNYAMNLFYYKFYKSFLYTNFDNSSVYILKSSVYIIYLLDKSTSLPHFYLLFGK